MKVSILLLTVALLTSISPAAILKVASDGTQPYNQISDAITVSASGDTILVMGGGYAGFTVPHRLVVIGAGTGMGIGEGVLVGGIVEVLDAADSTELRSLWIRASATNSSADSLAAILRIRSGATRIFVWRCFIENTNGSFYTACNWVGVGSRADFVQCTLWNSGSVNSAARFAVLYRSNATITLAACAAAGCECILSQYSGTTGSSATVSHCILTTRQNAQNVASGSISGVMENCAFIVESGYGQSYSGGFSYSHCGYSASPPPGGTHTLTSPSAFVNLQLTDARASNYYLAAGSNLINAGNPGSPDDLDGSRADIGIYGGQHPYVDGGVPDYPFAVQVEVPYSAPLNGTMRIWGRGRVGPGN